MFVQRTHANPNILFFNHFTERRIIWMVSGKSSGHIPSITIKDASFYQTSTTFILYGLATFEACFLYRMTFFIHRSRWEPLICEETVETFLINSSGHEIQFRRSQLLSDLQVQIVGAARDFYSVQQQRTQKHKTPHWS